MSSLELMKSITAKEKANELYNKFLPYTEIDVFSNELEKQNTKQCALISINEMLDFRNDLYINENSLVHKWLLEVKKEIELL